MQTLTKEQFEKLYGTQTVKQFGSIKPSGEVSFGTDAVQDIKETGTDLKNTAKKTFGKIKESVTPFFQGKQEGKETLYQAGGALAGGVSSAIGDVFKGTAKTVLPESAEQSIKSSIESTVSPVVKNTMDNPFVQALMSRYENLDPDTKRNIDATLGFTSLATELVGGGLAKKPISTAVETGINVAKKGVNTVADVVSGVAKPITNTITGVKDAAQLALEGASRVPGRIATNVAEKKAIQQTIKELPTDTARRAVQNGVDIRDVQILYNIPKEQKSVVAKLVKNVQDFESGASKIDPMETVGQPFVNRLKTLQSQQSKIGKQLGEVADNLGDISEAESFFPVYDALKTTRGLEGLKLADDGTLDFADTVLATAETASDRSAIQSIFNDAVKASTGKQKHLLRQELRESLGGKKRGGVQITGTQENAYESIRRGLSNVLDNANPKYREVNTKYAKVSKPIDELVNILKSDKEGASDVLNLSGGILARRLTSAGIGNANVRRVLQLVDNATKVKGKTLTSVETLQDVMNVLGRYYDIAPRTGFKNLTQEALSGGIKDFVSTAVGDVAGRTDAVRKVALNNLLKESLSN